VLKDVEKPDAGLHDLGVEAEDADIIAVADDHALVGIEHAQAMRHVLDGGRKTIVLFAQFVLYPRQAYAFGPPSADGRTSLDMSDGHEACLQTVIENGTVIPSG
jgi:hypothetical protein